MLFSRSRYTGKERDPESGNDYFGARYYASTMGRFMSPDWSAKEEPVPYATMGDPQSLNLYAYVRNNPLRGVDPDGHEYLITEPTEEDNSNSETNSSQSVADQQQAQQQGQQQSETVGKTTVGALSKTMSNEDRSLSGGASGQLVNGKTALANAIINGAKLSNPPKVAPATGTPTSQDAQIMQDAYTNRVNGGDDPVNGRVYYGTTHNANVQWRSAGNGLPGAAGRETVYQKFGPFKDSISPNPTWIVIYNKPGQQ